MSKQHEQYHLPERVFEEYNKETTIQDALGSRRQREKFEASSFRSTNYKQGVSGWKITPSKIEIAYGATGTFLSQDAKTVTVEDGIITSII